MTTTKSLEGGKVILSYDDVFSIKFKYKIDGDELTVSLMGYEPLVLKREN